MLKQANESDWKEVYRPISLCSLGVSVRRFCAAHNLKVFSYIEDGLGTIDASIFDIDGTLFWLMGPAGEHIPEDCLFEVLSYEPDTEVALERLCTQFGLAPSDIEWKNESLGRAHWTLSRYDDNGNHIEMFKFHTEQAAIAVKERYEAKGHKQAYFVSRS